MQEDKPWGMIRLYEDACRIDSVYGEYVALVDKRTIEQTGENTVRYTFDCSLVSKSSFIEGYKYDGDEYATHDPVEAAIDINESDAKAIA